MLASALLSNRVSRPLKSISQLMSSAKALSTKALVYESYGVPTEVLRHKDQQLGELKRDEAHVEILASAVNPSDINTVEGTYPLQPPLPAVPGNEGVGIVRAVGSEVSGLKVGDRVVPLESGLGFWRESGFFPAGSLHPIPESLPLEVAATLCINPPTALRMLEEYVQLQAGDVVVQNGANSAVGKLVIQLAAARGLKTINLVRDRPDLDKLKAELEGQGATLVTTEEDAKAAIGASGLGKAALGLNCIGGSASSFVAKNLREHGVMVTYGAMSKQPVSVPTGLFIFKDIQLRGFWQSKKVPGGTVQKRKILDTLIQYYVEGQLKPLEVVKRPLSDFHAVLSGIADGSLKQKVLFVPG